jgi:hypothetical protein
MNLGLANQIPAEVLAQIFLEGELPSFPYLTDRSYAPLQVCRSWRKTALESSELWTHIDISSGYSSSPGSTSSKVERLSWWIRRSKNRTLVIRLEFVDHAKGADDRHDPAFENNRAFGWKIMVKILSVARRWGDMHLQGSHRDFVYLFSGLPEAIRLRKLTLEYITSYWAHWSEQQLDNVYKKPFFHQGLQGPDPFHVPRLMSIHLENVMFYHDNAPPFIAPLVTRLSLQHMSLRFCDLQSLSSSFPATETFIVEYVSDAGNTDLFQTLTACFPKLREISTKERLFDSDSQKFFHAAIRNAPELQKAVIYVTVEDLPCLSMLTSHIKFLDIRIFDGNEAISHLPTALSELHELEEISFTLIADEENTELLGQMLEISGAPILQLLTDPDDSGTLSFPSLRSIKLDLLPFRRANLLEMACIRFAHAIKRAIGLRISITNCFALPNIDAQLFEDFQRQLDEGEISTADVVGIASCVDSVYS